MAYNRMKEITKENILDLGGKLLYSFYHEAYVFILEVKKVEADNQGKEYKVFRLVKNKKGFMLLNYNLSLQDFVSYKIVE
jgi:phage regulator Rha-like protein